jgi:hypothetical protein
MTDTTKTMPKIGDMVKASNILTRCRRWNVDKHRWEKYWKPHTLPWPIPCGMYLGSTTLFDGHTIWEGEEVGNAFTQTRHFPAVVIQPLDLGGRYRKPEYVLIEDMEAQP